MKASLGATSPIRLWARPPAPAPAEGELSGAVPSRQGPVPGAACVW